jgi:hypothetical protein
MSSAWPPGEVIIVPVGSGPPVTVSFAAPFEPSLTMDGLQIPGQTPMDGQRALQSWLARHLPALWRCLGTTLSLRGTLTVDGQVVVSDVLDDQANCLDHLHLIEKLQHSGVVMPAFAVLGTVAHDDLADRARALFASGTPLEVRVEGGGRVLHRERLRIDR